MVMADVMVEITDVYKSFGSFDVLKGVTISVTEGENLVIFGKSGTGKSVLLKCVVGLLYPDRGDITVHGKNILNLSVKELNALRLTMGFLFQSAALYDSMTVRENLEFPLQKNFSFTQGEITKKVERALEMVSLSEAIDKMPSELSGGMRKRIGLARSIITEPKLMLFDEPTTGLDPITTKEISQLIRDLQTELKMTSLIVTHDLVCAKIISDYSIVLRDGVIYYQGQLEGLMNSKDAFLQNFFSFDYIEDKTGV